MKYLHLLSIVVLLALVSEICCKDEPHEISMTKREAYTYNIPSNYPDTNVCRQPPACLPTASIPNLTSETAPDTSFYNHNVLFYAPMGSCWGYNLFANMLLGREVFSYRELEEMCLTGIFGGPSNGIFSGYGDNIIINCTQIEDPNANYVCNCTFIGGTPGTDWSLEGWELAYPVLSDGKSWVVYYRCMNNRHADFKLWSTKPYVEQSVITQVMALAVNQLGFSAEDIKILQCKFPTYPVPLQNYPVADSALSKSCSYPNPYSPVPQKSPTEANNPPHYNSHPYHSNV